MAMERQRCTAHRTNGQPCQAWAMHGQAVCVTHGGAAAQNRAAATRRLEQQHATDAVRTYGLPRDVAPDDALLEEVHRTAGHVAYLNAVVGDGNKDDLTQWAVYNHGDDQTVTRRPSVWVELYQAERKHLVSVCKAAIAAGIAERQIKMAEAQATLMVQVIMAMIDDPELGLDSSGRAVARKVAARHLRLVEAPGA
jgi:hypothetical protein